MPVSDSRFGGLAAALLPALVGTVLEGEEEWKWYTL